MDGDCHGRSMSGVYYRPRSLCRKGGDQRCVFFFNCKRHVSPFFGLHPHGLTLDAYLLQLSTWILCHKKGCSLVQRLFCLSEKCEGYPKFPRLGHGISEISINIHWIPLTIHWHYDYGLVFSPWKPLTLVASWRPDVEASPETPLKRNVPCSKLEAFTQDWH